MTLITKDAETLAMEIWNVSRAGVGTISATGANIVAKALIASGAVVAADSLADELRAMGAIWGGDSMWVTTGTKVADLMAETLAAGITGAGPVSRTAEKDTPVPDDGDPWRCAECGGRREVHIVGERDGTVTHVWQPRVIPPTTTTGGAR